MSAALEATTAHAERLVAAFGGSCDGWAYTGESTEGDDSTKCPCGHQIRNMFWWQHEDGRRLFTGSVCVETLPGLTADTMQALRDSLAALREQQRKAAQDAKVQAARALVDEHLAALDALAAERKDNGRMTYRALRAEDFAGGVRFRIAEASRLKSAHGQAARLRKVAERAASWVEAVRRIA